MWPICIDIRKFFPFQQFLFSYIKVQLGTKTWQAANISHGTKSEQWHKKHMVSSQETHSFHVVTVRNVKLLKMFLGSSAPIFSSTAGTRGPVLDCLICAFVWAARAFVSDMVRPCDPVQCGQWRHRDQGAWTTDGLVSCQCCPARRADRSYCVILSRSQ